ncbi:MAG: phosphopyruvate hydratase [Thermoprotei archaeon]|nr:MAG: phosphopyruvate hydratase [Thermoprotei archaeon]
MLTYNDDFVISTIKGRWILDSRGNPTVEAEVYTLGGGFGRAAVPSGASTGTHEAIELRDGGKKFHGKGVEKAVRNINEIIAKELVGLDSRNQALVDMTMLKLDGTPNKSRLGANAILAVSLANAHAASATFGLPLFQYMGGTMARTLPVPLMNIINGGKHAGNELKIQEFMIVPIGGGSFSEALRIGSEVYHTLKNYLKEKYGVNAVNVGDEGGFAPPMKKSREALDALIAAIKKSGYEPGVDVMLAIDAAASEFYIEKEGVYEIDGQKLTREQLLEYYEGLLQDYPIVSIEDPFHEEDFEGFAMATKELKIQIVGDDIFVTNVNRLRKGIEMGAANALLLKVNQIGTLTEALEAARLAMENKYSVVVSHRSGETEDVTIAHIAVALNCGQIKTGAPARGERTAKYNELLRIEEFLGRSAYYPGLKAFRQYKR